MPKPYYHLNTFPVFWAKGDEGEGLHQGWYWKVEKLKTEAGPFASEAEATADYQMSTGASRK